MTICYTCAMRAFQNFVNGKHTDAADGRTTAVVNPSTGEQYANAPLSGPADIDAAMEAASAAFEEWGDTTPSERSLALFRIADAVEARAEELIALEGVASRIDERQTGAVWRPGDGC